MIRYRDDLALLLENKIDAPAQPTQAARYQTRDEHDISTGNGQWPMANGNSSAPVLSLLPAISSTTAKRVFTRTSSVMNSCETGSCNSTVPTQHSRNRYIEKLPRSLTSQDMNTMNTVCQQLHQLVASLPHYDADFDRADLSTNGLLVAAQD